MGENIIEDLLEQWKMSEYDKNFTLSISYVVKTRGAEYPISLKFVGRGFDANLIQIDKKADMPLAIAEFVEHCGLTQVTLWDAYYLAREEVFVSRSRRKNVK